MMLVLPQIIPLPWKVSSHDGTKWKFAAKFYLNIIKFHKEIIHSLKCNKGSGAEEAMLNKPDLAGVVVWPFMCAEWDVPTRVQHIASHYSAIKKIGPPFIYESGQGVVLLDHYKALDGMSVVLDEPIWFLREGKAVISIFFDQVRAYSLAFSLRVNEDGSIDVIIGAIQGRNVEGILDTYRSFTKSAHGVRPRDFLIEIAKMLFREIKISRVFAVSEASRIHKHTYFGNQADVLLSVNYDEVWEERGGEKIDTDFWELPIESTRKDFSEIKSKKRSLYRKRYAMFDDIQAEISNQLLEAKPTHIHEDD